jgi:hypothetical protein
MRQKLPGLRTPLLLAGVLLAAIAPLSAQDAAAPAAAAGPLMEPAQRISIEAQAVIDRMTAALQNTKVASITSHSTSDEVLPFGYVLQNNQAVTLTFQSPNKLRAEVSGDIRNRTYVYDGANFFIYSPDDNVHTQIKAPDTTGKLVSGLLDIGVEMPLLDVLYQGHSGTLLENVKTGIHMGDTSVQGVECELLAFRQATIDWQICVQKSDGLPRKFAITTRYAYGQPQVEHLLTWNLKPTITADTFTFKAPEGSVAIPLANAEVVKGGAP